MVETKAVSVRLPLDLLNELNSYATDKGMVRGGDANIGGAIIAILKSYFGEPDSEVKQVSNNVVKQLADSIDFEEMVNNAVESRLEAVLNQVESLRLKVHSQETYSLLYTSLKADVDNRFDETNKAIAALTSEATAPAKKLPDAVSTGESVSSVEPESLPIIEAIATIAAPIIENPLPDETLSDAIAATDRRFTLQEAVSFYNFAHPSDRPLKANSLKQNAKAYGFMIKERGSGMYALIES